MEQPDALPDGSLIVPGPVGGIDVLVDRPAAPPRGVVIVGHPQPLLGGSARHKIPQFLAGALRDAGWLVVRPNFRGVGQTQGEHDAGLGETDDMLAVVHWLQRVQPGLRIALVGFSFGAFVLARLARAMADAGAPAWRVCLAGMPFGTVEGNRRYDTPGGLPQTLVIHGEQDERVPLSAIMDWARPDGHPVVVVPGANHFFSGRLPVLRSLVLGHLDGADPLLP